MAICCALLKHGYSNFSLIILEYCLITELLIREKHYQKTLKPEYNIAKEPGAPMSGRKHSDATKIIMSGRTHSDATKKIMSDAKKGENHPNYGKTLSNKTKKILSDAKKGKPSGSCKPSQQIEVTDIKNNITTYYDSINEAARALNIKQSTITNYILRNQQNPYKGIYTFKKVEFFLVSSIFLFSSNFTSSSTLAERKILS